MKISVIAIACAVLVSASAADAKSKKHMVTLGCDTCAVVCYTYVTDVRYKTESLGIVHDLLADLVYNAGGSTELGTVFLTGPGATKDAPSFKVCVARKDAKVGKLIFALHTKNTTGNPPAYFERFERPFHHAVTTIKKNLSYDP